MWLKQFFVNANRLLNLRKRTEEHQFARDYWTNCSNSFLASDPKYYDRQETALREILADFSVFPKNALDIGCGSGRFSFVVAEVAGSVTAYDLAQKLIDQALIEQARRGVSNVTFLQGDLEKGLPKGRFDLVCCMGVVSTLIDDLVVEALLDEIADATNRRGFLITKDTLSAEEDGRLFVSEAYVTRYRTVSSYEQAIGQKGFVLIKRQTLAEAEGVINYIYIWQRS